MKPPSRSQRRATRAFVAVVVLLLGLLVWNLSRPTPEYTWTGTFMDQPYTVIIRDRVVSPWVKQMLDNNIQQMFLDLETRFYRTPGLGIVADFNSSTSTLPTYVGTEIWRVVNLQKRFSQTSKAADITAGQLYDVWSRVRAGQIPALAPAAAHDLLRNSGMEMLMAPAEGYVRKLRPQLSINIDSAAQGYATDRLEMLMTASKITHFHVQVGGTILSREMPHLSASVPVTFAYETPTAVTSLVHLTSSQMATRGPGDGFNHIDPRTGMPVSNNVYAVSVLAESALVASSLATTLYILGPEDGLRWLANNGVTTARAVFFVTTPDHRIIKARSVRFPMDGDQRR